MRVHLIGADLEENLALGILAAVVERLGHTARIVPFNDEAMIEGVARAALRGSPDVIGLSMQFQHRAAEFHALARRLRALGFRGHITAGGQLATLAWREALAPAHGIDTIVLHDGEETLAELLAALERGARLADVPGLALRADDGAPVKTTARRLLDDLDAVPFPRRYRPHTEHLGVPFIPIMGGRGCWGRCSYCSIVAFYHDAIDAAGGGRAVRTRSPDNVAAEMALLLEQAGGRAIFCFHDDNFVFPSEKRSLERLRAIRGALDGYGVGEVALVGKARPDCVTPSLARELAELGVVRLYLGVENGSTEGGAHLGRGKQQAHVSEALAACREAGIFVCYNLLVFEPDATLENLRDNARFIRDHADSPVNFCRAEPYFGTLLHRATTAREELGGGALGFNYRIVDDRVELCFRICSAAFRERNFATNGVANRAMGLGYAAKIFERFHGGPSAKELTRRAAALTRRISLDTSAHLDRAIDLAERVALDDRDTVERETALLGLSIAAADRRFHEELDELVGDMEVRARKVREAPRASTRPSKAFKDLKASLALGMSLAFTLGGCGDVVRTDGGLSTVDPAPGDAGGTTSTTSVVDPAPCDPNPCDPAPPDAGTGGAGGMVVDPAVQDAGTGGAGGTTVVDPPPPDAGVGGAGGSGGFNGGAGGIGGAGGTTVVDPPPPDAGMSAVDVDGDDRLATTGPTRLPLVDKWTDTSTTSATRTDDLALHAPPRPRLTATHEGARVRVRIGGAPSPVTTRWEAEGSVEGDGLEVLWRPDGPHDRVRVAIRSRGGVAVLSLGEADALAEA